MKDFYSIRDFYNSLQNPLLVPTTHRHFQVYLYPIYSEEGKVVRKFTEFYTNQYGGKWTNGYEKGNGFFANWFTEQTIEQFSLAIQKVTFPTKFSTPTQTYTSPFGNYNGVDNNNFYGKINDGIVSFSLIDQISPFFEKKINEWIFTINRTTIPNQAGTLFPKVNMAIKYFRQDQVYPGTIEKPHKISPNFIYYFKEAFPIEFETCTIDHSGNDGQGDLRRALVFKFNNMYVLHDADFAKKYGLEYLFNPVTVS